MVTLTTRITERVATTDKAIAQLRRSIVNM